MNIGFILPPTIKHINKMGSQTKFLAALKLFDIKLSDINQIFLIQNGEHYSSIDELRTFCTRNNIALSYFVSNIDDGKQKKNSLINKIYKFIKCCECIIAFPNITITSELSLIFHCASLQNKLLFVPFNL